jgi:hypothetical protein
MWGPLKSVFWVFAIGTALMIAFEARQHQGAESIFEVQPQTGSRSVRVSFDPQIYRAAAQRRAAKYQAEECFDRAVRATIVNGEKDRDRIELLAFKSCHSVLAPALQSRGISSAQVEENLAGWGDAIFQRTVERMGIKPAFPISSSGSGIPAE